MFLLWRGLGLSKSLHRQLCLSIHIQAPFPNFQWTKQADEGGLSGCLGPQPDPDWPLLPPELLPFPPPPFRDLPFLFLFLPFFKIVATSVASSNGEDIEASAKTTVVVAELETQTESALSKMAL